MAHMKDMLGMYWDSMGVYRGSINRDNIEDICGMYCENGEENGNCNLGFSLVLRVLMETHQNVG